MTVIADTQGAIKISEIAFDEAISQLGSSANEDALTVIKQLYKLAMDGNIYFHAFSNGRIAWDGSSISFIQDARNNQIIFRILKSDGTYRTVDLVLTGGASNTTTTFNSITLNNNELIYVEIHKSQIEAASTITLQNAVNGGSVVAGKTVKKVALSATTGMPKMSIDLNGDGDVLNIPIAFRYDWTRGTTTNNDLMWACNGERWKKDSILELGASVALSQGGAILNFLEYSDKAWDGEVDTSGWSTYNDSTAIPVDGMGGTVNANFTFGLEVDVNTVLSGGGSFKITKNVATNLQGHGVAVDFTIPKGYQKKRLLVRALYAWASSSTVGQVGAFIIANPTSAPQIITPYNNSFSNADGELTAVFDPIPGVSSYRLCFHVTSALTNTFTLVIDEVKVHAQYFVTSDTIASPAMAGFIQEWGGSSDIDGWMICDGRELQRSAYPELFANIGTSFGTSSSSTFNLPDFRGQFLRGKAPSVNQTFATTAVDIVNNTITLPSGTISRTGMKVRFTTTGALPGGINTGSSDPNPAWGYVGVTAGQPYYYWSIYVSPTVIKIANTLADALAGTAIDITSVGSGTHTISQWIDPDATSRTALLTGGASGNAVGSYEEHDIVAHEHNILGSRSNGARNGLDGAGSCTDQDQHWWGHSYPYGGNETRPSNISVNYLIKLYNDKKNTTLTNSYVEYASNTTATNTASDITSFTTSIIGSFIPNESSGITTMTRRVQWGRNTTIGDRIFIETDLGSNGLAWVDASQHFPRTNTTGMYHVVVPGAQNQLDIMFLPRPISGALWSQFSTWRWRVVLTSNPNAVETATADSVGVVKMFAGDNAPSGYLVCDGQQVSRSSFSALFGIIGTKWGSGDGVNTFNLPDFRGVFPRGAILPNLSTTLGGTISSVDIVANTLTLASNHGFNRTGFPVRLSGSLPAGTPTISIGVTYYAIIVGANQIALATTIANALNNVRIDITTVVTGGSVIQWIDPDDTSRVALNSGGVTGHGGVGTYEDDQFMSHYHTYSDWYGFASGTGSSVNAGTSSSLVRNPNTGLSGGNETRPKNINVNFIIKY